MTTVYLVCSGWGCDEDCCDGTTSVLFATLSKDKAEAKLKEMELENENRGKADSERRDVWKQVAEQYPEPPNRPVRDYMTRYVDVNGRDLYDVQMEEWQKERLPIHKLRLKAEAEKEKEILAKYGIESFGYLFGWSRIDKLEVED